MASDARTQWAAYELQRRLQRADTPTEEAAVWRDAERARQDPEFLARLAEIAEHGKYSSGPWGLGKLALAGGALAGLFPPLAPLGLASGAALAGLAIPTGLEAMQRRSEGLPWKWQAAESALDLAAPGIGKGLSKVGGLLRGLRGAGGAKGATRAAATPAGGVSEAGPFGYSATGVDAAATPQASILRGWDDWNMPDVDIPRDPRFGSPTVTSAPSSPTASNLRGWDDWSVPAGPRPHPSTRTTSTAWRTEDPLRTGGWGPSPVRQTGRPPVDVRPRDPRTRTTSTAWEAPTEPHKGAPWGGPTGTGARVSPDFGEPLVRPTAPPKPPTGTPSANPSEADAAVAVAKSPARAADEVLSAMEADVDKLTGVTDHQAAFLRSFLGQIDDFGEPVLQRLRAGDVPAQEIVFDRVLRFIDQQRLSPGVKPRERAAIGHLYASGGLGGGMSKNVPGLPSGWLAASPGRVITKEGRDLRGTFPGMENVSVGAAGQPVPHFTALPELPIGKNKASDVYRKTVRASKAGTEEWDDVESAVRESAKESRVSISNDQVALVTAFRVAYDRFDAVYKYIKHVVGAPHRRVTDPATGKYVNVKAYHPIWKQHHKTGDQRTAMGDMRSVMKRVASGEWDASKIQTIINQLNRQALQVLGVIGSVEMARRALAPEQTPNAPLT